MAGPASGTAKDVDAVALEVSSAKLDDAALAARVSLLRARGPEGLSRILADYDSALAGGAEQAKILQLRSAIDQVAAQRDAWLSRLYWYTDLESAEAAAKSSGKPILSLRLLGRLDEELSCANSRLFRLALYADPALSKWLAESYVLHWSSERPVPKLTVDYGDGRTLERTVTGNSLHFVLDSRGRPVDAIPGLYGPGAFRRALEASLAVARSSGGLSDEAQHLAVAAYHEKAVTTLTEAWHKDLVSAGLEKKQADAAPLPPLPTEGTSLVAFGGPLGFQPVGLPALYVGEMTMTKAKVERPVVQAWQPRLQLTKEPFDLVRWSQIGILHLADGRVSSETKTLASLQRPLDFHGAKASPIDPSAIDARIAGLERTLADEGTRNEYVFHGAIHDAMAHAVAPSEGMPDLRTFAGLDEWIYVAVFLTPASDKWLGLASVDAFTGITDDGLHVAGGKP